MSKLSDYIGVGGGGLVWYVVSTDTTADVGEGYMVDCSSNPVTITFPSDPAVGGSVGVKDYKENAINNNITIGRNGKKIEGSSSNFVFSVNGRGAIFVYTGSSQGWVRVTEMHGFAIYR